jgi:hypothetical protein
VLGDFRIEAIVNNGLKDARLVVRFGLAAAKKDLMLQTRCH